MNLDRHLEQTRNPQGFTLVEVVISLAILGLTVSGILLGYTFCSRQAEWGAYSLAAQADAEQRLAQVRLARWTTLTASPIDDLVSSNFPVQVNSRDSTGNGMATFWVTNFTTLAVLSTNPPLKFVRIDAVWKFAPRRGTGQIFTNTLFTYRGPDE